MIEFGIKDFLDILLVASLLFYVYRLMKESRSLNIFVGIMLFVLIWLFVSQILEMRLLATSHSFWSPKMMSLYCIIWNSTS